jgi:hypothetical protein
LFAAMRYCTGSSFSRVLPMPSVVVIIAPSSEQSGRRQELMAVSATRRCAGSQRESMTVQAPQPPSPQESFVPVSPMGAERSQSISRVVGSGSAISNRLPLT